MRKRELIERIEKLEKVVEFLSRNKLEEIAVTTFSDMIRWGDRVEYVYDGEVKCVRFYGMYCEVVENRQDWIIVRAEEHELTPIRTYYKIDKATAEAHEIPKPAFVLEQELAEKEQLAKKEKSSGNKKRTKGGKQAK